MCNFTCDVVWKYIHDCMCVISNDRCIHIHVLFLHSRILFYEYVNVLFQHSCVLFLIQHSCVLFIYLHPSCCFVIHVFFKTQWRCKWSRWEREVKLKKHGKVKTWCGGEKTRKDYVHSWKNYHTGVTLVRKGVAVCSYD